MSDLPHVEEAHSQVSYQHSTCGEVQRHRPVGHPLLQEGDDLSHAGRSHSLVFSLSAAGLITAISRDWIRPFGGVRLLIADGETAIVSDQVTQFLDRTNVQFKAKAPG